MAAGEYMLVAGLNAPGDMVHAIFRGKDGEKGKLIPHSIYERRTEFINCMTVARFEQLADEPFADAPTHFLDTQRLATLTAEEDAVWTAAFEQAANDGKDDNTADHIAWYAVCDAFPRLKDFDGCTAH